MPQSPAPPLRSRFKLYASSGTETALHLKDVHPGFEQYLADSAGRDIAVLRATEILALSAKGGSEAEHMAGLRDLLKAAGFPYERYLTPMPNKRNTKENIEIAKLQILAAANNGSTEIALPHDGAGVIVYDDRLTMEQELGRRYGMPAGMIGNIPTPMLDSREAVTMLHEARHFRQQPAMDAGTLKPLTRETQAEGGSLQDYFRFHAAGAKLNPDYPLFRENVRAIAALRESGSHLHNYASSHAVNLGFDVQGRTVKPVNLPPAQVSAALLTVNTKVFALLGVAGGRPPPLNRFLRAMPDIPVSEENYRRFMGGAANGPLARTLIMAGRDVANAEPILHYAAVKWLYGQGVFQGNRAEEIAAREFIEGFDKRVPALAGAGPQIAAFTATAAGAPARAAMAAIQPALQSLIDGNTAEIAKYYAMPAPGRAPFR